jgi:NAD-dependent SIR2 family protein deacetylase
VSVSTDRTDVGGSGVSGAPTIDDALALLRGARIAVLTGAGMSTDSGIPDYRGPDSPPRTPMTFQQFVGDPVFRRHYWARNHVGWRRVEDTQPNAGHRALVQLEGAGLLTGLITQNVDRLHERAGSRNVIDLHGSYLEVICLSCGNRISRDSLAIRLEELNPDFAARVEVADAETAPDADAVLATTDGFVVADCLVCGGLLKPDIVYFGENVPKPRVAAAFAMVDAAAVLLVAGSSLTVMSGLRFVRHAVRAAMPVVIVNRGVTRGDPLATVKLDAGCTPTLTAFATALAGSE